MLAGIIINVIACIELLIGLITIASLTVYTIFSISQKPFNVFVFVCVSSGISILIGIGLLKRNDLARRMLIFFSAYIILTKFLIFSKLLFFSGEILDFIPRYIKDWMSIGYHYGLVVIFNHNRIKKLFIKR